MKACLCVRDILITSVSLSLCLCVSQGGERLPGRDAARVGHRLGPVSARADGSRGGGALRAVRRAARGQRRLRLHGQSVGP